MRLTRVTISLNRQGSRLGSPIAETIDCSLQGDAAIKALAEEYAERYLKHVGAKGGEARGSTTQKARPRGPQGPDRKGRDSGKKPREGPADSGAIPAKAIRKRRD